MPSSAVAALAAEPLKKVRTTCCSIDSLAASCGTVGEYSQPSGDCRRCTRPLASSRASMVRSAEALSVSGRWLRRSATVASPAR